MSIVSNSILIPIYALSFSNNKTNKKTTKNQQISKIVPYLLTLLTYGKKFFLFYWLLFYRPLTGMHWDKRYVFLVNTCVFFLAVALNQCALTPGIRRHIFRQCRLSPHHVLAWFRTRGVGAPLSWLSLAARRVCRYEDRYRSYVGVHHRLGCAFRWNSGGFRRNSDKRHRPERNVTETDQNRHRNVL